MDWVKSAAKPHCGSQIGRQEVTLQHQKRMEMSLCAFSRHIWASTSSGSLTLNQCRCYRMSQRVAVMRKSSEVSFCNSSSTESVCVRQPRPECPQQEKSNHRRCPEALLMTWQADYTATCVYVVCVCPSTSFLGSLFTALDMAPCTFFPYEGILEFQSRMVPCLDDCLCNIRP